MADKEGARERIALSLSDGIDASLQRGASLDDVELVRKFRSSCAGMDAQRIGCVLFHKSTVLAVTQAWSQCWRFSEDEVRGRTLALLQGPKSKTAELISFQKQLRLRSGPCAASLINYTKNGRPMPCFVHAFPIGKDHYVSFMICGISQDRALSSSLGNTELKSSNDPDAVENNEDYTFADVQDFVANLSAVQNNTHTPKNKLYVSDQCNLMFALYEIFWHILFYFTGPLSLLVIVPVCGTGFAKLHGFLWMGGNGAFTIIMMAMEYAIFALVSWSTVRFVLMTTEAEAISGADLGTTNMTSMNASLSPSPSPIASSWANSAQMSAQWRCADLELDVGTPLFFVLVRLVVIVTKYARMTGHGRDKLMHHTQTLDKRVDFVRRTLLAAWAGIAFDAWPSKLAVESEFDRIPNLREHKVMLASTPAATQALGLQNYWVCRLYQCQEEVGPCFIPHLRRLGFRLR